MSHTGDLLEIQQLRAQLQRADAALTAERGRADQAERERDENLRLARYRARETVEAYAKLSALVDAGEAVLAARAAWMACMNINQMTAIGVAEDTARDALRAALTSARGTGDTTGALEARVLREVAALADRGSTFADDAPLVGDVLPADVAAWLRGEADKRERGEGP